MAEGFLKSWGEDGFEVYSAGISVSAVNPLAVKVMDEVEIDISAQKSKSVGLFLKEKFDCIITVCGNAKEVCPNFPGEAKKIHWSFEDPAIASGDEDEKTKVFRKVRDQIAERVKRFIAGRD